MCVCSARASLLMLGVSTIGVPKKMFSVRARLDEERARLVIQCIRRARACLLTFTQMRAFAVFPGGASPLKGCER